MPTHFGPSLGPRHALDGSRRGIDGDVLTTGVWASFQAEPEQIASLLPEGFEPAPTPDLTVEIKNMTNIGWLAGRGYSVVTVTAGVRFSQRPTEDARFKLVLWENAADPIITGREELGYPKLFSDISDVAIKDDRATASASWDGFIFLDLNVTELATSDITKPGGPSYHFKYIPRTGASGRDVAQIVLTPPGQGPVQITERRSGVAELRIFPGTWQQLPTLVSVVAALAGLELGPCVAAGIERSTGGSDLSNQVVAAELD